MLAFIAEWSLRWEAWLILAFALGGVQMLLDLDVSFFGGASAGGVVTAAVVGAFVPLEGPGPFHWGMTLVIWGVASLSAAAILKKYVGDPMKDMPPDPNEAPWRSDED